MKIRMTLVAVAAVIGASVAVAEDARHPAVVAQLEGIRHRRRGEHGQEGAQNRTSREFSHQSASPRKP